MPPSEEKKKSKKRKRSEPEPTKGRKEETVGLQSAQPETRETKKRKKKTKKRRKDNNESITQRDSSAATAAPNSEDTEVKEDPPNKKKRKKAKKKKKANDVDRDNNETSDDKDRSESPTLEGSMVDGTMVLIDRTSKVVYSAMDRDEKGNRVVVGTVNKKGKVIMKARDDNKEKENKDQDAADEATESAQPAFPYETDPDDHCESPLEAYEDIVVLLKSHARKLFRGKATTPPEHQLTIYDPYFCNGRVANHLKELGFPSVYNRKEDCYQVWNDPARYPNFKVFLTNPPYSGDHIEKLMEHVTGKQMAGKPWMLLMDYFQHLTCSSNQQPIYLVPHKRYIYQPPANFRDKKASDTHKKSSPFVSMWYLWGGSPQATTDWYQILQREAKKTGKFDVARSKSALRDLRRKPKARKR